MKEIQDIGVTLDVVLSVPAKNEAEAYEKLSQMKTLRLLKMAVEQCEFDEAKFATKH